jgi:excisionase family DNA binding protein
VSAASRPPTPPKVRGLAYPKIALDVPDSLVEAVALRAAAIVIEAQTASASPWLSTEQAADYLAAKPARVHDLVALGKLTPRRDGRRLLFRRDELDAYIEASA